MILVLATRRITWSSIPLLDVNYGNCTRKPQYGYWDQNIPMQVIIYVGLAHSSFCGTTGPIHSQGTWSRSLLPFSLSVLFRTSFLGRLGSVCRVLPLLSISPVLCNWEGANTVRPPPPPPPCASDKAVPSKFGKDRTFLTDRPCSLAEGESRPALLLAPLRRHPTSTMEADPGLNTWACTAVTSSGSVSEGYLGLSGFCRVMSPLRGASQNSRLRDGLNLSEALLRAGGGGCC